MEDGEGASGDSFPGWSTEAANESVGNFLYRITVTARHTTGANVAMTRFFFDAEEAEEAMAQQSSATSSPSESSSSSSGSSGAGGS
jgi:hypothetical protein